MNREAAIPVEEAIEELAQQRRFRPYPDYRDSGVAWLGELPGGWQTKRLKFLTHFVTSGSRGWAQFYSDEGAVFLRIGNLSRNGIDLRLDDVQHVTPPDGAEGERTLATANDLLLSVTAYIGAVAVVPTGLGDAYVNQHTALMRLVSAQIEPRWAAYCLCSPVGQRQVQALTYGGTKDGLGLDDVKNLLLVLPSMTEQQAIAAFLDRETARIDELVAKQQRLIELLAEKRTALISHAVTKGLNPDAPMKDSEFGWLGSVPEHWSLSKLGYITTMQGGGTPSKDNLAYWNGSIPWVSPKDMKRRIIDNSADHVTEDAVSETTIRLIDAPAVLIVVRGMILSHSFPVGLTSVRVTINQDMKAISVKSDTSADFLAYLLQGIAPAFLALVEESGHGTKCLRTDLWKGFELFMPPIDEQEQICEHLRIATAAYDRLVERVSLAVDRLDEYRSAVISAAVRGKIDVRGFKHEEALCQ